MSIREYAARQVQQTPELQEAQPAQEVETLTANQLADRLQAERLTSLVAGMQDAIDTETAPAVMLTGIIADAFGKNSEQAAAVERLIESDKLPGGYEQQVARIRERAGLLKRQRRQLEAAAKATEEDLARLDLEEQTLLATANRTRALDAALVEVMTFVKLNAAELQPDLLQTAGRLYDRHHGSPAAMGLLYGGMIEIARSGYSAGGLDLVQQQAFIALKEKVAAAVEA